MSALPQQLESVVFALCEDTNTPRSLAVKLLVEHREYGQLVNLTVDPLHYTNGHRYYLDVVVTDLLRKIDIDIPGIDKVGEARRLFEASEHACYATNARLKPYLENGPFEDPSELRIFESIERMKNWINIVLGRLPEELDRVSFGPGATFEDIGRLTTVADKISNRPTMTNGCVDLLPLWYDTAWARAHVQSSPVDSWVPKAVRGNRFTTVPKDATKDRGICIEPSLNVFYQLGVGKFVRRSLKSVGIDLTDGQDIHRQVACEASRGGAYATVDLRNASDTMSYNLIKLLLPRGWFDLVDMLRSPSTRRWDDQWHILQKFSSMGNGFTFELETLVFTAIMLEACYLANVPATPGKNLFVYGDDIIVPVKAQVTGLALLRFFGFTPNPKKTFPSAHKAEHGKFRESCGGDFFDGIAVRPHYLKEIPDEPAKWISLANGIRRLGREDSGSDFRYSIFWRAWLRALDAIPSPIRRLRGPEDLGDLVIHDIREFWRRRRTPDQRTFIRTWAPIHKALPFHHWKGPVVYACMLYGIPVDPRVAKSRGIIPRDGVDGYRIKWTSYAE